MIRGSVTPAYEAVIGLTLQAPAGATRDVEAVIDTGFNAFLSLPPDIVTELELPAVTTSSAILADGSEALFSVHEASVLWEGEPRRIYVHASDTTALVGMRLLDGHSLYVEVEDGGRVVIEGR